MYYEDLSPYEYGLESIRLGNVLCIGWLDKEHPFEQGFIDEKYIKKLEQMICEESIVKIVTNQTRGFHYCHHCNNKNIYVPCNDKPFRLGSNEIWIPSKGKDIYYAAPSLIIHYIKDHQYKPPQEFLDSIWEFETQSEFYAEQISDEIIEKYGKKFLEDNNLKSFW